MRKLELSPYYPPRAHWYSPLLRIADGLRRVTWLDRIHLPAEFSPGAFGAALFVPGLAFRLRRERLIGNAVMAGYALLAVVFFIWLGYLVANIAFGLMLSLHATSIMFLCSPWLARARLGFRLLMGVAVLVVVGGLIYAPIRNQLQNRWLMPLRLHDNVVVVQTFSPPQSVKRGDWVAYRIAEERVPGLLLRESLGLRPVIGLPGDQIQFTPTSCLVNGVVTPRLSRMPDRGGLVVKENHWFIWPELVISTQGNGASAAADAAFLRISDVEQIQYLGKPFRRWFGRKQHLQ
jgi:hypothetical protein